MKRRAGKTPEKDEPDYRYRWPTQQTLISQESDDVQTKLDKALRAVGQPLMRLHWKTEDGRHKHDNERTETPEQKGGSQESGPEVRVPKKTTIFFFICFLRKVKRRRNRRSDGQTTYPCERVATVLVFSVLSTSMYRGPGRNDIRARSVTLVV